MKKIFVVELESWISYWCISIVSFVSRRFWPFVFCCRYHYFGSWAVVHYGRIWRMSSVNNVKRIGGQRCCTFKIICIQMIWWAKLSQKKTKLEQQFSFDWNSFRQCYIYSWYLAVDMQLYFIAPAIMYLIYRFKAKAISALVVLILSCIACTLSVHVDRGLKTL